VSLPEEARNLVRDFFGIKPLLELFSRKTSHPEKPLWTADFSKPETGCPQEINLSI
jgi:hypothetical protein